MIDERIAPYVPTGALHRPAGAVVTDGMVTCVSCEKILPIANADIVGLGYRCVPCSQKAHVSKLTGGGDAASHLSDTERSGLRKSGNEVIWAGVALTIAGGMLMAGTVFNFGMAGLLIGVITIAIGVARKQAAN